MSDTCAFPCMTSQNICGERGLLIGDLKGACPAKKTWPIVNCRSKFDGTEGGIQAMLM